MTLVDQTVQPLLVTYLLLGMWMQVVEIFGMAQEILKQL